MDLRYYQEESAEAAFDFIEICQDNEHPIIALPTGSGKTVVICEIVDQVLSEYPDEKILILSHVKEILQQDYDALTNYFEGIEIGLYSAGLESRTIQRVTVASIHSIIKHPELVHDYGFVLIDECHMIPMSETSMYRSFLDTLDSAIYIGLTATPFRLGSGYLHTGDDALFTDLIIDYTQTDKFNKLIDEGYLSQLYTPNTADLTGFELNTKGLKKLGGDFKVSDMSDRFDREAITDQAINITLKYGEKYKKWIIFAIDIEHAEHIAEMLNDKGIPTICVHSKMGDGRDQAIYDYKHGEYRALVCVDIATTGFDAPTIDMIVSLRPTESPVFHAQSTGRGLRVVYKPGMPIETKEERLAAIAAGVKSHCFVLDFAGNTKRLGPINDLHPKEKRKGKGGGDPIVKTCPNCKLLCSPSVKFCPACNWKFEFKQKINPMEEAKLDILKRQQQKRMDDLKKASDLSMKRAGAKKWVTIESVGYSIHSKIGSPSSLKVGYQSSLQSFNEWVTIDHKGMARHRALNWIKFRLPSDIPMPSNLNELVGVQQHLRVPSEILVDVSGKYPRILDTKF